MVLKGQKLKKLLEKISGLCKVTKDSNTFQGFDALETKTCRKNNMDKIDILKGARHNRSPLVYNQVPRKKPRLVSLGQKTNIPFVKDQALLRTPGLANLGSRPGVPVVYDQVSQRIPGLVNLGNSCYMSSVMQCLNCAAPLVKYFIRGAHLEDINPLSSYGGTVAREVGAAFILMTTGKKSPVSLQALKSKVGDLHHQFSGCGQHDSHEFLVFLLTWLHEDLKGRELSALLSSGNISGHLTTEGLTSELSIISLLFQGEHKHVITCKNCHHESISLEPFNILSLSLPASGNCTLTNLLQRYYECCCIEYSCPGCNKRGESSRKTFIQRLPPMLLLHFNHFEYNISARKKA